MNRIIINSPKDLKRKQSRIYDLLDDKTPYIISGNHFCNNENRYNYLSEQDPHTLIIETNRGMIQELNVALYVWYMHYDGEYTVPNNECPACHEITF